MRVSTLYGVVAVSFLMPVKWAGAQEAYTRESLAYLKPGTRLRITAADIQAKGGLAHAGDTQVYLAAHGDTVGYRYDHIRNIDVSRGRKRGSTALTAGLGIVGLGVGIVVAASQDCESDWMDMCGLVYLTIPPAFAAGGLILGWGVGKAIVTERWLPLSRGESVPDPVTVRAGGPAMVLSVQLKL